MSTTAASLKSARKADSASDQAPDAAPKKSKKKLFVIIAVLVILVGGYEAKSMLFKPHYKPGQKVPLGKIIPLDQLTVNLSDNHLVQVSISLQLTSVANTSQINGDLPRFEDAAITVFGGETMNGLLPESARQQVKNEILIDCQKIAGTVDGAAQQISAVYFTSFVLQ